MSELNSLLLSVLVLLAIGVFFTFIYYVINDRQTRIAIIYARRILNAGQADSEEQFRSVYRRLATTRNDLEAAKLWKELDELRELTGIRTTK